MLHEGGLARPVLTEDRDRFARLDASARRRGRPRCRWGSDGQGRRSSMRTADAPSVGVQVETAASAQVEPPDGLGDEIRPSRRAWSPAAIAASSKAMRRIDPGSLGEPDERRRRRAACGCGLWRARRPGTSRAIACARVEDEALGPSGRGRSDRARRTGSRARSGRARRAARRPRRPGRIELGRRLVEHEDARAHRDDARDRHALLLAAGQGERLAVGEVADRQPRERRVDPGVHLVARDAQVLEPERELLAHGQLRCRELVGRRREDDPDPAQELARGVACRCRRSDRPSSWPGRRAG